MPARWTAAQDGVLLALYHQGVALRVIAARTGRSENAVAERRRTLGIAARRRSRAWSPREDDLLRAGAAAGLPAPALASRLGRPPDQVRRRRSLLLGPGRAPRPYSAREDDAIRACWARDEDPAQLARTLGRPAASIRLRAQRLGLHRPAPRSRWRPQEDGAVRDGYERGLTCEQIAADLAGRTASAVAVRAARLGLATYARAWTPRDDRRLRQLSRDGLGLERAARILGRTPEALRARTRKLGVAPLPSRRARQRGQRWTAAEDELLRLHGALNPATLAELLDRSPEAVTQRLRRLGLRRGAERSPHHPAAPRNGDALTPGQRATVARELRTGGPRRRLALAQRLGVRPADIPDASSSPRPGRSPVPGRTGGP